MKRLEEWVTCEDDTGRRYEIEVFRHLARADDGSQVLGRREAFLKGDPPRPVRALDDADTFQTKAGRILRRVKQTDRSENQGQPRTRAT